MSSILRRIYAKFVLGPVMIKKHPLVDIGRCTLCGGCMEVAPHIFRVNKDLGYVEVIELDLYPEEDVEEAIKICPEDCIAWET
jgi:ferredoxin